jgi:signal transduction histidine kinase/CheY-like chemotaxis protein
LLNSEKDTSGLIHELQVHQIELEMQNEELVIAKDKADLAEEKYVELYDFAPTGYLSLAKNGRISELNFAAARMLGNERLQLKNATFALFINLETRPIFNIFFDNIYKTKVKETCEVIIAKEGNLPIYVHIEGIASLDSNFCLLTMVDITERKLSEIELIKAKGNAEDSDKLKTAFLQNMSHEIRTPLNGILGFSNLLQDENIEKEDIKTFTGMISQCGHRLLEIVNNVLDISKIETGQMEIRKITFSLNSMITNLHTFFSPLVEAKNLKLKYTITLDSSNSQIISDDTKLNQILTNLINNAIKFTSKGSIDFGYEIVENNIQFYVRDTGMGISVDDHQKIFDRFIQVDVNQTRAFDGAGLGLAICKGLVEMLGGKIWLESEIDAGTTFFFTIPYNPTNPAINNIQHEIKIEKPMKNIKILIAEDDLTCFMYLSRALKDSHYILVHAVNGEKAVEFVKNTPDFDLVLMDIRMPVMGGLEAIKQIKELRPDLPIIAQTAYAFHEEKEKILAAGCIDYLTKPFDNHQLLKLIEKYVPM